MRTAHGHPAPAHLHSAHRRPSLSPLLLGPFHSAPPEARTPSGELGSPAPNRLRPDQNDADTAALPRGPPSRRPSLSAQLRLTTCPHACPAHLPPHSADADSKLLVAKQRPSCPPEEVRLWPTPTLLLHVYLAGCLQPKLPQAIISREPLNSCHRPSRRGVSYSG